MKQLYNYLRIESTKRDVFIFSNYSEIFLECSRECFSVSAVLYGNVCREA